MAFASAFGLVTGDALEKVSSLPLKPTWGRRAREMAVTAGERLDRAVALWRTP